ncbi:MAG: sodium:solute symporter family protein [Acutalibacteraceae bacterium]|jgi:SSS family solute:Na+ symporter
MGMADGLIVAGYVLALVGSSLRGGKGIRDAADFTASSGTYGTFVIFATMAASYIGGGYSSGNAAAAFESGIGTTLALCGFSLSTVIVGKWIAPRAARFTGEATVGAIMERCYGKSARRWTGLFAFLVCAGVVGAQAETMGVVLRALFGWPEWLGSLLGCGVVLVYSTFGGMKSVIVADVAQFLLLAVGMPVLLIAGLYRVGGLSALANALPASHLDPFSSLSPVAFVFLFGNMMLGEALVPPYTQRLLIGKNARATVRGTVLSGLFSAPFFALTGTIGLIALALGVSDDPATAMPALIGAVLPVGLRGLVMAAMVSVTLSAADSFLNSASISLICDVWMPAHPIADGKSQLMALRATNLLTGTVALAVSFALPDVFGILMLAYACWAPLVVVPLAAALLGVRSSGRAFRRGMLCGLAVTLIWNGVLGRPFGADGTLPGTLGNLLAFWLSTRALRRRQSSSLQMRIR